MTSASYRFFQYGRAETVAWRLFLVWTCVGAAVLPFGIDAQTLGRHLSHPLALRVATALLSWADLIWMVFATFVIYYHVVAAEGIGRARLLAAICLVGAGAIEWVGATTGYPFGPYRYTEAFGPLILGVLPVAIPLAWLVILLSARYALLERWPELSRFGHACGIGMVALLTDVNLEFVAWKVRGYWIWYPNLANPPAWPPLQNYVAWFALAALLSFSMPRLRPRELRPARRLTGVLLALNALFFVAHVVRWTRG